MYGSLLQPSADYTEALHLQPDLEVTRQLRELIEQERARQQSSAP